MTEVWPHRAGMSALRHARRRLRRPAALRVPSAVPSSEAPKKLNID
jgi:hypothetical protein